MTTTALPAPVATKNRQARGTVAILNIARWVGVALFALLAFGLVVVTLVSAFEGDTTRMLAGAGSLGVTVVFGALFYAIIGWYVDTLALLTQIARNTAV
jgi:hypothetical protein